MADMDGNCRPARHATPDVVVATRSVDSPPLTASAIMQQCRSLRLASSPQSHGCRVVTTRGGRHAVSRKRLLYRPNKARLFCKAQLGLRGRRVGSHDGGRIGRRDLER